MRMFYRFLFISLKTKLSLLFLLLTVVPFTLLGYYSYNSTAHFLTQNVLTDDAEKVETIANQITKNLASVPNNLIMLANFYTLSRYMSWRDIGEPYKTKKWLNDTIDAFASLCDSIELCAVLQLIDPKGQELLRIEDNAGEFLTNFENRPPRLVDSAELKNVQQFSYVEQVLKNPKENLFFISELRSLRDVNDKIYPAMTYSAPVIDENKELRGIMAFTIDISFIFKILNQKQQDNKNSHASRYLLLDQAGNYLVDPTKKTRLLNQQLNDSIQAMYPNLSKVILEKPSGMLIENNMISSFQQIKPLESSTQHWILIKQTDERMALAAVENFKFIFVFSIIAVVILVIFVANQFTQMVVSPLLQINELLKNLAQGRVLDKEIQYDWLDEVTEIIAAARQLRESLHSTIQQANAIAQGNYSGQITMSSEHDQLNKALIFMTEQLREMTRKNAAQDWLKTGQAELNSKISGEQDIATLSRNILNFICRYLNMQIGVIYLLDEPENRLSSLQPSLKMIASYGYTRRKNLASQFALGEGLVGQAALERQAILISQVPDDYIHIQSGLGEAVPRHILVLPFLYEDGLKGIIELGGFEAFSDQHLEFLRQVAEAIAIATNTAQSRTKMQELLNQTQTQAEELQAQAEELQSQTEELQTQQEELRQTNDELQMRTRELERQKDEVREKNTVLERTQRDIEEKARELELASKYKSEFLANMSHELRTPLNSLLILAQLLSNNKAGNLNVKQVEYAKTIHSAGNDLLTLINEILDLSKVEAGKMDVHLEEILLPELAEITEHKFHHVAENKKLAFSVNYEKNLPPHIYTDGQRLKQILNNLLSNAFKFTASGSIRVEIGRPVVTDDFVRKIGLNPQKTIKFSVIDSGIGIPKDKLMLVFEAFQQADGTTNRRFGGTGLGLSISRQLSRLLGGDIHLSSEVDKGSIFTLYLPEHLETKSQNNSSTGIRPAVRSDKITSDEPAIPWAMNQVAESGMVTLTEQPQQSVESTKLYQQPQPVAPVEIEVEDDRFDLQAGDKFILVVEDDRKFSGILIELAREKDFKCILAEDGKTALQLAEQYQPNAIILDVGLPKVDGWTVMERLKDNPKTRHIPVHFMSAADHGRDARNMGAIGYLLKPVSMNELSEAFRRIEQFIANTLKNLVIVVENQLHQDKILDLVSNEGATVATFKTCDAAHGYLLKNATDCLILDIELAQGTAVKFLQQLAADEGLSQIPVIIYADRELTLSEEQMLQTCSSSLTVKAVRSPERLLDEATLFLHQLEAKLPNEKRKMLQMVHDKEAILRGKRVLVVDDDMRNTFALATVLEEREMEVIVAKNGRESLRLLDENPDIALILMDIMMPEMDGYEAMRKIREQPRFRKLPMIALTAKAMKGDKAKCIEAGANDYLAKPVDTDKLVSLMRVWLYR